MPNAMASEEKLSWMIQCTSIIDQSRLG